MGLLDWVPGLGGRKAKTDVLVKTDRGAIKGYIKGNDGVHVFRGVPYATARRFKRSEPHPSWEGVKDCTKFGPTAVQGFNIIPLAFMPKSLAAMVIGTAKVLGRDLLGSTDPNKPSAVPVECSETECLNLNIETPSLSGSAPVMVFIHGGAFMIGSNSMAVYNAAQSPFANRGAVIVTINYRLGVLGFLKVKGGDYNCGISDQISALEWVQRNISSFGGDPSNVCIFGESAGAMSVGVLMAAGPKASPHGPLQGRLFRRCILQSGGMQVGLTREESYIFSRELARALDMPVEDLSVESTASLTPEQLYAAQNRVLKGRKLGMMPFQPVMDGEILEQPIVEALRAGAAQELEAMVGYTKEEELLFNHIMPWQYTCQNEGDLLRKVCKMLGPEMLDVEEHEEVAQRVVGEVKDWAAGAATAEQESAAHLWTRLAIEASSACKFAVPAHVLAEALVGRCRAVYMFRVDVHSPALRGAAHALDLPYVFDNCAPWGRLVPPDAQANAQLCEAVNGAWVGFATKGDPNAWAAGRGATRSHLPPWPTLTGEDPCQLMVVDLPLAKCRVQHVPIHKAYPQLWEIVNTNVRAMWFLRPLNGNSEEKSAL